MCLAFCSDSKWILFLKTLLLTGEINFSMSSGGWFSGVQAEGAKARTGERKRAGEWDIVGGDRQIQTRTSETVQVSWLEMDWLWKWAQKRKPCVRDTRKNKEVTVLILWQSLGEADRAAHGHETTYPPKVPPQTCWQMHALSPLTLLHTKDGRALTTSVTPLALQQRSGLGSKENYRPLSGHHLCVYFHWRLQPDLQTHHNLTS